MSGEVDPFGSAVAGGEVVDEARAAQGIDVGGHGGMSLAIDDIRLSSDNGRDDIDPDGALIGDASDVAEHHIRRAASTIVDDY